MASISKTPDRSTLYFSTLTKNEQEKFLNYELTVYFCEGTDKEKLDWFRVINIAGEKLLDQELLNAVYTGPFVSDARRHFSKNGCPAYIALLRPRAEEKELDRTISLMHLQARRMKAQAIKEAQRFRETFPSRKPRR